jgi:hypothetical protein
MKTNRLQSLTIVLGVILSLAIICSNLFQFQGRSVATNEVKTEQTKNQKSNETVSIFSSFSLPTPAQVQLTLQSYCLFEISFEKSNNEIRTSEIPLHPEKLLQTLFSVIIAPNAP